MREKLRGRERELEKEKQRVKVREGEKKSKRPTEREKLGECRCNNLQFLGARVDRACVRVGLYRRAVKLNDCGCVEGELMT